MTFEDWFIKKYPGASEIAYRTPGGLYEASKDAYKAGVLDERAQVKKESEIAERAGKYSVWHNIFLFFKSDAYKNDPTAQFILEWAIPKMETHKPYYDLFESDRILGDKNNDV